MRFVGAVAPVVLAMSLGAGCKDKPSKLAETGASTSAQPAPARGPGLPKITLHAPMVGGAGVEPARSFSARVFYSTTYLGIDDTEIATMTGDGLVDPQRIDFLIQSLEEKVNSDDPLGLVVDGSLTFARVAPLLGRLKRAGFRNLAFVTGDGKLIPIAMPDPSELGGGLRPVVTVQSGTITLWSLSGEEGTQAAPKATAPIIEGPAKVTAALGEIVRRRWPEGTRAANELTITIQVERTQSIDVLMRVIAGVRADAKGPLFPNIFLTGI